GTILAQVDHAEQTANVAATTSRIRRRLWLLYALSRPVGPDSDVWDGGDDLYSNLFNLRISRRRWLRLASRRPVEPGGGAAGAGTALHRRLAAPGADSRI
ncbi:unnamed protein product, partial [Polarella glacialis]